VAPCARKRAEPADIFLNPRPIFFSAAAVCIAVGKGSAPADPVRVRHPAAKIVYRKSP